MSLRPQDLLVSLKLALDPELTYTKLSEGLEMSLSEAHGAVRRATDAGLLMQDRQANRSALLEFVLFGAKYAFYPKRGRMTRGVPTAHGAPAMSGLIRAGNEPVPVWPSPEGTVRGEAFEPIYGSVPVAAAKDPRLYEILSLFDAIRGGRARERNIAEKRLREILAP